MLPVYLVDLLCWRASIIDAAALALAGSAIAGGLFSKAGAASANAASRDSVREQLSFQEWMGWTQYQRAVWDMKQAGLNPMLAYQQGGNATAPGASYVAQNENAGLASAVSSAAGAMLTSAQIKNLEATTDKTQADTALSIAAADRTRAEARAATASAAATEYQVANMLPHQADSAKSKALIDYEDSATRYQENKNKLLKNAAEVGISNAEWAKKEAEAKYADRSFGARVREEEAAALLAEYQVPGARNQRDVDETYFGKNVRPYIHDFSSAGQGLWRWRNMLR